MRWPHGSRSARGSSVVGKRRIAMTSASAGDAATGSSSAFARTSRSTSLGAPGPQATPQTSPQATAPKTETRVPCVDEAVRRDPRGTAAWTERAAEAAVVDEIDTRGLAYPKGAGLETCAVPVVPTAGSTGPLGRPSGPTDSRPSRRPLAKAAHAP